MWGAAGGVSPNLPCCRGVGARVWWQCAAEPGGGGSRLPGSPTSRYIDPRLPNSPPGNTLSSLSDTVRALDTGQLVDGGQYLHWTRDTGTCGHSVDTADQGVSDTRTRGANNGTWISQGLFLRTEEVTFGQYRKGRL